MRMSFHKDLSLSHISEAQYKYRITIFPRKERTFSAKGALLSCKKYGRFAQKVRTFLGKGTF